MKKSLFLTAGVLAVLGVSVNFVHNAKAMAQPMSLDPAAAPVATAPAIPSSADARPSRRAPDCSNGCVMLADLVPEDQLPRAARESTVAIDTPVVNKAYFMNRWFQGRLADGEEAWQLIMQANSSLCKDGEEIITDLLDIRKELLDSKAEYAALEELFRLLPKDVQGATTIMTVAQAIATGAYCVVTGLVFCLAQAVSSGGYVFGLQSNKRLSLANIKLAVANIRLTKTNIKLQMVSVKAHARWALITYSRCGQLNLLARPMLDPVAAWSR